jgi:hypothetical protein
MKTRMKFRINAGSDVAMIGAWDVSRNDSVLAKAWGKEFDQTLEQDATSGDIFVIRLGGDAGGPIDIYVDAPIPKEALAEMRAEGGEFLLRVPSGRLMVGGVEDYRSAKPKITGPDSVIVLAPGDYALRCYSSTSEEGLTLPTGKELKAALGADDYAYRNRIDRLRLLGYLLLLLFPVLSFPLGWKWALLITVVVFFAWFYVQEQILVKRNARYQRIEKQANQLYGKAKEKEPPWFIFDLRLTSGPHNLKGGSIRI